MLATIDDFLFVFTSAVTRVLSHFAEMRDDGSAASWRLSCRCRIIGPAMSLSAFRKRRVILNIARPVQYRIMDCSPFSIIYKLAPIVNAAGHEKIRTGRL